MEGIIKGKLDIASIPDREFVLLARAITDAARQFFKKPENVSEFKEWKARRSAV